MSQTTEKPASAAPGRVGWRAGEIAIALIGLAWVVLAALWAAPGVFTIEGLTYLAMIDAFAWKARCSSRTAWPSTTRRR